MQPTTLYTVVNFITNFLLYMSMLVAVQINGRSRLGKWTTLLISVVSFAGYTVSAILPFRSIFRALYGWAYVVLAVQLLYKDKWYLKLLSASASVVAMLLADMLYISMFPRDAIVTSEMMISYPISMYSGYLFADLVMQSINVVFVRMLLKRSSFFSRKAPGPAGARLSGHSVFYLIYVLLCLQRP